MTMQMYEQSTSGNRNVVIGKYVLCAHDPSYA